MRKFFIGLFLTIVVSITMTTFAFAKSESTSFSIPVYRETPATIPSFEELARLSGVHDDELLEKIYRVFILPDDEITRLYEPFTEAVLTARTQYGATFMRPFSLSDERTCTQVNRFGMAMGIVTDTPNELMSRLAEDFERSMALEAALLTLDSVLEYADLFDADGNQIGVSRLRFDETGEDMPVNFMLEDEMTAEMALNVAMDVIDSILGIDTFFDANGNPISTSQSITRETDTLAMSELISNEVVSKSSSAWDSTQTKTASSFVATGARIDMNLSLTSTRMMLGNVAVYVQAHTGGLTSSTHTTDLTSVTGEFKDNMRSILVKYYFDAFVPNYGWQSLWYPTTFFAGD